PRGPDVAAQPSISPETREPHREDRVEVERGPARHPGIEKVLKGMEVSGLALAEEGHTAIEVGTPSREAPGPELACEVGAVREVDLGDVEVEEGASEAHDVPEEHDDRGRPHREGEEVRPPPGARLVSPNILRPSRFSHALAS